MSDKKPSVNDELNLQAKLQETGRNMQRKPPIRETKSRPKKPSLLRRPTTRAPDNVDPNAWRSRLLVQWPRVTENDRVFLVNDD